MKKNRDIKIDHIEVPYDPKLDDYEPPEPFPFDPAKMKPNPYAGLVHILPPYANPETKSKPKRKRKTITRPASVSDSVQSANRIGEDGTRQAHTKSKRVSGSTARKATKSKSR